MKKIILLSLMVLLMFASCDINNPAASLPEVTNTSSLPEVTVEEATTAVDYTKIIHTQTIYQAFYGFDNVDGIKLSDSGPDIDFEFENFQLEEMGEYSSVSGTMKLLNTTESIIDFQFSGNGAVSTLYIEMTEMIIDSDLLYNITYVEANGHDMTSSFTE